MAFIGLMKATQSWFAICHSEEDEQVQHAIVMLMT